jgi:hypothetical protein
MTARRLLLVLGLLVIVAGLAAWGLAKTASPVHAAATQSADAGGAQATLTATMTPSSGAPVSVTANGVFDQQAGDFNVDLSGALAAAGAPAGAGGNVEIRYLQENGDPVVYANAPFLSALVPGGASWVKLDLQQVAQGAGFDLNAALAQAEQNPTTALDMLKAAGSVSSGDQETIGNNVSTTHYVATIDLNKIASNVGGTAGQNLQQALSQSGAPTSIPVDVWIDDSGYVRQVVLDENLTHAGQSCNVHVKLDINGYDTPVTVATPPSDQTFDATSLASMFAAQAAAKANAPAPQTTTS